MKYRKRPIVIEAYQTQEALDIVTLEGTMHADPGDWIITGVKGEQYPCKPDIFEATYEDARRFSECHDMDLHKMRRCAPLLGPEAAVELIKLIDAVEAERARVEAAEKRVEELEVQRDIAQCCWSCRRNRAGEDPVCDPERNPARTGNVCMEHESINDIRQGRVTALETKLADEREARLWVVVGRLIQAWWGRDEHAAAEDEDLDALERALGIEREGKR